MYTVRNIAFDTILSKYETTSLTQLDNDQLEQLCDELKIQPVWKATEGGVVTGLDTLKTIEVLNYNGAVSVYMGKPYWEARHREIDERLKLTDEMNKHVKGDQTFDLLASVNMGISKLLPGQTAQLDVSAKWLTEELLKSPLASKLKITDSDGNVVTIDYKPGNNKSTVSSSDPLQTASIAQSNAPHIEPTAPSKAPFDVETADYNSLLNELFVKTGKKYVGKSLSKLQELYRTSVNG